MNCAEQAPGYDPENTKEAAPRPPTRDRSVAKAIIINSISLAFMIAEGEIDADEAKNALQGMAQAYKVISDREFGEYGLVDKVTSRILDLRQFVADGDSIGGLG